LAHAQVMEGCELGVRVVRHGRESGVHRHRNHPETVATDPVEPRHLVPDQLAVHQNAARPGGGSTGQEAAAPAFGEAKLLWQPLEGQVVHADDRRSAAARWQAVAR